MGKLHVEPDSVGMRRRDIRGGEDKPNLLNKRAPHHCYSQEVKKAPSQSSNGIIDYLNAMYERPLQRLGCSEPDGNDLLV